MSTREFRFAIACLALIAFVSPAAAQQSYDLVVYGGTSGGAVAAVQAARMGYSAVVIEPGKHLGGLTSGGLGATDIGNKAAIGGISREFYRRIAEHYASDNAWRFQTRDSYRSARQRPGEDTMWTFEPHVAENIFKQMLREAGVSVVYEARLDREHGVVRHDKRIISIATEDGRTFIGRMFIDATYEGDLLAAAGVSYHVGREANSVYDETLNGVQPGRQYHQFNRPVDPFITPGDPSSGLLPCIHGGEPGRQGEGDKRIQAYNFRLCMTDVPENQIPFSKPPGYNPQRYELLRRYIEAGVFDALGSITMMPNRKTDMNNNGAFSTDHIGGNYDYPEGDYKTRERILRDHVDYQMGLMYFLANDPRLPDRVRERTGRWGLAKDEFVDTAGWPHQMYVREARRMTSDYVMTQHHCQGRQVADDPIGLAAYTMDSHNTQRYVQDGYAINEGDVQVGGFPPYPISYRSIVPKKSECANLLAPVCLSASHIAYGSIRMEPVFMVLGQSAATAAVIAIQDETDVQSVGYEKLQARLLADKQVLEWTGGEASSAGIQPRALPGVIVDDPQARFEGAWVRSVSIGPFVGSGYRHDDNTDKGEKQARFQPPVLSPGPYQVGIAYSSAENRATNVPVTIHTADGPVEKQVNQRRRLPEGTMFHSLGIYRFAADGTTAVVVGTTGTDGHVIVDAVQFLPVAE